MPARTTPVQFKLSGAAITVEVVEECSGPCPIDDQDAWALGLSETDVAMVRSGFTLDTHTTNAAYLDGLLGTIASRED